MKPNYQNIEAFLEDESFVNFVRGVSKEDEIFWKQWLIENSHSQDIAEEARLVILGIPFKKADIADEEISANLSKLKKELEIIPANTPTTPFYQQQLFKWVATICLLLLGAYWMITALDAPELISRTTGYGESQKITLADGSTIHLNANSTLSYASDLESSQKKELILEGEAYFDMKKQENGDFYSIIARDLTAKVLGTSFNINTRTPATVLSLDEGRISLKHKTGESQEIEEGSVAHYDVKASAFHIEENRNKYWNSWTEEIWIFDETITFERILERIENNYGLSWKVKHPELLQRKLEGSVSIESLDVLLESLSYIFDIKILRNGKTELIIK